MRNTHDEGASGRRSSDAPRPSRVTLPPEQDVADVADVFALLGDPARVRILTALLNGPLRVRDLAGLTGTSESAASHALRLLRAHRVISASRHGREVHYELDDAHVRALLQLALDHIGHTVLMHVAAHETGETDCLPADDEREA